MDTQQRATYQVGARPGLLPARRAVLARQEPLEYLVCVGPLDSCKGREKLHGIKKTFVAKGEHLKTETRTVSHGQVGLSDLEARLKASPHAGGPILNIRPTGKVLQRLIPPANIVTVKSGLVSRGESPQPHFATGVAGFAWDVPAPDPNLGTAVWATISFDWAFYG